MSEALRRWLAIALVALSFAVIGTHFASAENSGRKVKVRVEPTYPELARSNHLSGVVKLQVTIGANGAVKNTHVIGGNPVLVESALDAIKRWRFENAADDTTQVVEFRFTAQ